MRPLQILYISIAALVWVASSDGLNAAPPGGIAKPACLVLGQPDFAATAPGLSPASFSGPGGLALDPLSSPSRVFVADAQNNRILIWKDTSSLFNGEAASGVIGQASLTAGIPNGGGGPSSASLYLPGGIAFDASGNLWVADSGNNRVLRFPGPVPLNGASSDRVLGQGGSFNSAVPNLGGRSAGTLYSPTDLSLSPSGSLAVADANNNRVMVFNDPMASLAADRVFGQGGDFSAGDANKLIVPDATTLYFPCGVDLQAGQLWVSDTNNNRVLEYSITLTADAAELVIGQNNFSGSLANRGQGNPSPLTLAAPKGLSLDSTGGVYITDSGNNRVLFFNSPYNSGAALVYGQGSSFNSKTSQSGSDGLNGPDASLVVGDVNLLVADTANNRILVYGCQGAILAATATPTPSSTPTFSATPTISPTFSASPSFTATATPTATPTASPTRTPTAYLSPTSTASPTSTRTANATITATSTPSPQATATPTFTPLTGASGSFQVAGEVIQSYPNPAARGGRICFAFPPTSDNVAVVVYDLLGEPLATLQAPPSQAPLGNLCGEARNDASQPLAPGIYYYRALVHGKFLENKLTIR